MTVFHVIRYWHPAANQKDIQLLPKEIFNQWLEQIQKKSLSEKRSITAEESNQLLKTVLLEYEDDSV